MVSQAVPIPAEPLTDQHSAVMIVEDEASSRRALSLLLSSCGYPTLAFASAEEALEAIGRERTPRIALIDLDLPGMNGLELIQRLQQLDPFVFPVLITATSGEMLSAKLHNRPLAYLRKPLDFESLLALLSQREWRH